MMMKYLSILNIFQNFRKYFDKDKKYIHLRFQSSKSWSPTCKIGLTLSIFYHVCGLGPLFFLFVDRVKEKRGCFEVEKHPHAAHYTYTTK